MSQRRTRSVFSFRYGIFDLDGTLVDSIVPCTRLFSELVSEFGIEPKAAARSYLSDTTLTLEDSFRRVLAEYGLVFSESEIDRLMAGFTERIRREPIDFVPGARRLIHTLRQRGLTLFVSSGSPDETVRRRLGSETVKGSFNLTFGSTAVIKGPEHIELFAEALGLPLAEFARNAFICGDFEKDMLIGRETGLYAIGVLGSVSPERLRRSGAKRIIPNLKTLLSDPH
jgi:phosphoglycolate phosphatase-like HAD superfamily hydrolase